MFQMSGMESILIHALRPFTGRAARIMTVGEASAAALAAHGCDAAWSVTAATVPADGLVVDSATGMVPGRRDVIVCIDALRGFDWLCVQQLSGCLQSAGRLLLVESLGHAGAAGISDRLDALARWSDLLPEPVESAGDGFVACLASKPPVRGARRLAGAARQRVLLEGGKAHARRRDLPSATPVPPATPPAPPEVPDLYAGPAFASAPPPAIYLHRIEVLARLVDSGVVVLGPGSYGTPEVVVYEGVAERLVVGAFSSIADDVQVLLGGNHRTDRASTYPFRARYGLEGIHEDGYPSGKGDVVVGSDVWIGRGAVILSGSHIGDGAVIGAGAVVSGRVRPYAVVVGSPGREVKRRFDDETVDELLAVRWWDWPVEEILANLELLNDEPIKALLDYARHRRDT